MTTLSELPGVSPRRKPPFDPGLMPEGQTNRSPISSLLRISGYTIGLLGILALLPVFGRGYGMAAFREGHFVEMGQFTLVALSALLLLGGAWRWPHWRAMLGVLGCLAAFAAVREMDYVLNPLLPLGWKLPAVACVIAGTAIVAHDRSGFARQLARFLNSAPFGILWVGALMVILFAQLIGHGSFLETILMEQYDRHSKRVVEELLELFGYLLILIGSCELLLHVRRYRPILVE